MIFRSIFFRLTQFVAASLGVHLLLMAGTFLLQAQGDLAIQFSIGAVAFWFLWGILTFLISRYDQETIREVALVVYPTSAVIALLLGIFLGRRLESMVAEPQNQSFILIIAGALLALVMLIRCLDIRWMRNAADLRNLEGIPHHDD